MKNYFKIIKEFLENKNKCKFLGITLTGCLHITLRLNIFPYSDTILAAEKESQDSWTSKLSYLHPTFEMPAHPILSNLFPGKKDHFILMRCSQHVLLSVLNSDVRSKHA